MERGSSSSSSSPSSNSSDSLNGLKFGQKIYFEDVGFGPPPNSFGGSSSSSSSSSTTAGGSGGKPPPPPTLPKKGRSGVVQGGGPPRCQVEGCRLDLSDAKTYYSRHKVCGMHSKSPKVVVGGLEQRFCQQCSRFHQLPEFDQGKRSCRRRLAGHNERRRKPPPGSLLSSHFGRVSSSAFVTENNRGGGFLMDFSTYPRLTRRDPWPTTRATDRVSANQHTTTGKFLLYPWQSDSENLPSDLFLQGSASGAGYSGPIIPSRECFTRVSDSGCAPSLLSNESWGSSDRSLNLGFNNFLAADGAPTVQSTAAHDAPINHFSTTSWSFKGNEVHSSSHEMPPDLGHHQLPQPASNPYPGGAELAHQSGRQYMELEHSQAYDSSTQHIHWSL